MKTIQSTILSLLCSIMLSTAANAADFVCSQRSPVAGAWSYGGSIVVHVDEKVGTATVQQISLRTDESFPLEVLKARMIVEAFSGGENGALKNRKVDDLTHFEGRQFVFDVQPEGSAKNVGMLLTISDEKPIQILDVAVCTLKSTE